MAGGTAAPEADVGVGQSTDRRKQPKYNVVLIDDNDHTYEYVIDMLAKLFHYGEIRAYQLARVVDTTGRVVLLTTTREHAELKQQQVHGFGADPRLDRSAGSMRAAIERVDD